MAVAPAVLERNDSRKSAPICPGDNPGFGTLAKIEGFVMFFRFQNRDCKTGVVPGAGGGTFPVVVASAMVVCVFSWFCKPGFGTHWFADVPGVWDLAGTSGGGMPYFLLALAPSSRKLVSAVSYVRGSGGASAT